MTDDVTRQVRQVVADTFGVAEADVSSEPLPETVETWDSVGHLNMIFALEQQFGVSFDPEEFEHLVSVDSIVAAVARRQA